MNESQKMSTNVSENNRNILKIHKDRLERFCMFLLHVDQYDSKFNIMKLFKESGGLLASRS